MNTTSSGSRRRVSPPNNSVEVGEAQPEQVVVPYDENLLERARTQWQFGDWQSLTRLDRDTLQHHPDRAKLALLAAAGQLQAGGVGLARQFIRLAQDWGCSHKLLTQILAAGVHNSLGRAYAHGGSYERAYNHFEKAIRLGSAGSDVRLMTQARAGEQFSQLRLKPPKDAGGVASANSTRLNAPVPLSVQPALRDSPISVEMFFSEHDGDRAKSLEGLQKSLARVSSAGNLPDVAWGSAEHRNKTFFFVHLSGDYIPAKIAEKKQFYEAPFLNLLARLHHPGRLIVDGGANIGNHSVFFAGVIGAPVIAFEPQPHNFELLLANVRLNRLEAKVDARNVAIGDRSGGIELVQALQGNSGSFTADPSFLQRTEGTGTSLDKFEANLSTLDEELANFRDSISIIKLDLEGMELSALQGARRIIMESMPVIAVECFTRSQYLHIKEFLAPYDYFVIDSTNATPTFIFLSRKSPHHQEMLSRYLEMSSIGRFSTNQSFNEMTG